MAEKAEFVALLKDVFAGEQRSEDEDDEDEDDLDEADQEKSRLRKLQIRALIKLQKHFRDEAKKRARESWDQMERVVVRLPESEMRALFSHVDE